MWNSKSFIDVVQDFPRRLVKPDFIVLSIQPGGELRDQTVSPSPGLLNMPSRLLSLDEFVFSFHTDGVLCASYFLLVGRTGKHNRKCIRQLRGHHARFCYITNALLATDYHSRIILSKSFPLHPIDTSIYRMRHFQEVSLLF